MNFESFISSGHWLVKESKTIRTEILIFEFCYIRWSPIHAWQQKQTKFRTSNLNLKRAPRTVIQPGYGYTYPSSLENIFKPHVLLTSLKFLFLSAIPELILSAGNISNVCQFKSKGMCLLLTALGHFLHQSIYYFFIFTIIHCRWL